MPAPNVAIPKPWTDAFLEYQYDELAVGRSPKTIRNRQSAISQLARHAAAAGITDPAGVTRLFMKTYMKAQIEHRRHTGAATCYQDVKSLWTWWAQAEPGRTSPMTRLKRPAVNERLVPVPTREQFDNILRACKGHDFKSVRNRAMLLLFLDSGIRRSELRCLDLDDIDLKTNEVLIRSGKGGKSRISVFGPDTALALFKWMRRRPAYAGEALFTGTSGARMSYSAVGAALHAVGKAAGMPELRPHLFRHAWAHYNLADGTQERDLMTLAAWTSSKMLGRYGASLAVERAKAAGHSRPVARLVKYRTRRPGPPARHPQLAAPPV